VVCMARLFTGKGSPLPGQIDQQPRGYASCTQLDPASATSARRLEFTRSRLIYTFKFWQPQTPVKLGLLRPKWKTRDTRVPLLCWIRPQRLPHHTKHIIVSDALVQRQEPAHPYCCMYAIVPLLSFVYKHRPYG